MKRRGEPLLVRVLWAFILAGVVGGLLLYVFSCAASGNKGFDVSKTATTTVTAPEVHGDDARITNISLTSVGGYGWGSVATLAGFVLWLQKRTRETAALRMLTAIEDGDTAKQVKQLVRAHGCYNTPRADNAERWINRQVKRL